MRLAVGNLLCQHTVRTLFVPCEATRREQANYVWRGALSTYGAAYEINFRCVCASRSDVRAVCKSLISV
jgi:hypothetical protein